MPDQPLSPPRTRRRRVLILALFLATPMVGGLLTLVQLVRDGVSGVDGIAGISDLALSPEGNQLYAVGGVDDALAVFNVDASSDTLAFRVDYKDGENGVFAMQAPSGVAASPDGRHVYATAAIDDTLVVFSRDATIDDLTFVAAQVQEDGVGGIDGLDGASDVAVSVDNERVFVTGRVDDALAVFRRDTWSNELTFVEVEVDGAAGVDGLDGASSVAVSPDDRHVYVAGEVDDAIAVFRQDLGLDTLTFVAAVRDGEGGANGLNGASSVAVSPDGLHVLATGSNDDSVVVFDRDPVTGNLSFRTFYQDGIAGVDGIAGARALAFNGTGDRVFVAGEDDSSIAVFRRRPSTGQLAWIDQVRDGIDGIDGLDAAVAVVSGIDVIYTAGRDDDAVGVYRVALCHGDDLSGDSDGDAFCDDVDLCLGDDLTGDGDSDGRCDDVDLCPGFDDAVDTDGDGTPNGCDRCEGSDDAFDGDGDGVPDGCDLCPGFDDGVDFDFDGVPDGCDLCLGFDDRLDGDGDGVPDGCDLCLGDDATGDTDGDGVCGDLDLCPGFDDGLDADGDGVPDGCDLCLGDDATGDTDGDGVCGDLDLCPGFDDGLDADGDGVPDGCDLCLGDDATGDDDGDGTCDDLDLCPGFDDGEDLDGDAIPDGCDACYGDNGTGDADGDGTCDDRDLCPGFDDQVDHDGDGVPDGCDLCLGDDATGDADDDGICADRDCDDLDPTNPCAIFDDGFESGDSSAWSATVMAELRFWNSLGIPKPGLQLEAQARVARVAGSPVPSCVRAFRRDLGS